jgi:hypothetical protein
MASRKDRGLMSALSLLDAKRIDPKMREVFTLKIAEAIGDGSSEIEKRWSKR